MLPIIVVLSILLKVIACRLMAKYSGDFNVAGLFNMRESPEPSNSFLKCGKIREVQGIEALEAALFTLTLINNDKKILPGVTLGLEVRDVCDSETLALRHSLILIRSASIKDVSGCSDIQSVVHDVGTFHEDFILKPKLLNSSIIGAIGPFSTEATVLVQSLLKLFNIPQIGFSDMTYELNGKNKYSTFLRVAPCDGFQTIVIRDILKQFNWTYVSVVYTSGVYGESLIKYFRNLVKPKHNNSGICIARDIIIESYYNKLEFDDIINKLNNDKLVNIIICFCKGRVLRQLFEAVKRLNATNRFTFITSDGWINLDKMIRNVEKQAWGTITVRPYSTKISAFSKYYTSLIPSKNTRNPWFNEFWEDKFNCTLSRELKDSTNDVNETTQVPEMSTSRKFCTGNENLTQNYREHQKIGFIMKAIWMMAYGLHNMMTEICGSNYVGICRKMYPVNTSILLNHLMRLSFYYNDELVTIDEYGNPTPRYEILNFQKLPHNDTFEFVNIADWYNGTLKILRTFQRRDHQPITNTCSAPCPLGYHKRFEGDNENRDCCPFCEPCEEYSYISWDKKRCIECPLGEKPNVNRTGCEKIPLWKRSWSEPMTILVLFYTITGIIFTLITFYVFIKYKDTPIVKASSRHVSYLILFSMIIAHVTVFIILTTPTVSTCVLSRTLPGIAFTMMFGGLLSKTSRIAKILVPSKRKFPKKKYRFISTSAQISITFICVAIEIVMCCLALLINPPIPYLIFPSRNQTKLTCTNSFMDILLPSVLIIFLQGLCILYTIKSRNAPGNFNEAKFIGFAMLISCTILIIFFPIYFGTEFKAVTVSMCITLAATTTLIFLFFPKLYIIVFKPEKNKRALFITNKYLRTHIGASVGADIVESPFETSIHKISEESVIMSGFSRLQRTVAVQTNSKFNRDTEIFNNRRRISFVTQNNSLLNENNESVIDSDNDFTSKYDNASEKSEFDKDIIQSLNNKDKEINWSGKSILKSLGTKLNSVTHEYSISPKNQCLLVSPNSCAVLDPSQLIHLEVDRKNDCRQNGNCTLGEEKSVSKHEEEIFIEAKRTRIREERTYDFHNGDPIFNITITLGTESPSIPQLYKST